MNGYVAFIGCIIAIGAANPANAQLAAEGARVDTKTVRVAAVNTPGYSGLLGSLIPNFEKQSGYRVTVHSDSFPYDEALAGKADIIISHFGREELESFVRSGHGMWPNTTVGLP